ncbi:hypothetical protein RM780_12455 [Streptomyces sp. DSM 44917]|uniref:Integral membrane protein n=1 Tax=Streptomyces boetiae TaxID=3075541 RepID=A0ABU2L874_9ACTN|nr:hypothetical protein [Streptomyces sp. DSM 44917]MDT0307769.1 hypothetical protein [Streptomyces sp. DSM 44917]
MSENTTGPAGGDRPSATERPRRVAAAALLCALQGAATAGLGALLLALAVAGEPGDVTQAVTGAITLLALAALPLAAGHGLWRLRRWSRGPAVVTQLLAVPVTITLANSGALWPLAATALGATALAVLACLINPTATQALGIGPREA